MTEHGHGHTNTSQTSTTSVPHLSSTGEPPQKSDMVATQTSLHAFNFNSMKKCVSKLKKDIQDPKKHLDTGGESVTTLVTT